MKTTKGRAIHCRPAVVASLSPAAAMPVVPTALARRLPVEGLEAYPTAPATFDVVFWDRPPGLPSPFRWPFS